MRTVHRFRHVASGETAEVINVHGRMVRIRWEDGIEDEYHITALQKLVSEGWWDAEE